MYVDLDVQYISYSPKCYRGRLCEREREMFYLTTHATHFIYGYMASDIWLRAILIVRNETRCRHIGYSFRLAARVLLYAPSHRQDDTYHGLCYTSRGALARLCDFVWWCAPYRQCRRLSVHSDSSPHFGGIHTSCSKKESCSGEII